MLHSEIRDVEHRRGWSTVPIWEYLSDFAPDHKEDKLMTIDGTTLPGSDTAPITKYRNAIRQLEHFLQAMRDVNQPHSTVAELLQNPEKCLGFRIVQRSRCRGSPSRNVWTNGP